MSAGLALGSASVTFHGKDDSDVEWPKASVLVRQSVLKLTVNRQIVREEPVTSVTREPANRWTVEAESGTYTVVRTKGCGCGG